MLKNSQRKSDTLSCNDIESEKADNWAALFIRDYENQCSPLNEETKTALLNSENFVRDFILRFCLDFLACQAFFGPILIAFWRGTWDYSLLYLDENFEVRLDIFLFINP